MLGNQGEGPLHKSLGNHGSALCNRPVSPTPCTSPLRSYMDYGACDGGSRVTTHLQMPRSFPCRNLFLTSSQPEGHSWCLDWNGAIGTVGGNRHSSKKTKTINGPLIEELRK